MQLKLDSLELKLSGLSISTHPIVSEKKDHAEIILGGKSGGKVKISIENSDLIQYTWRYKDNRIYRTGLKSEGPLWKKDINLYKVILERKLGKELKGRVDYEFKNGDRFDATRENLSYKTGKTDCYIKNQPKRTDCVEIPLLPDLIRKTRVSMDDYKYLSQYDWRPDYSGKVYKSGRTHENDGKIIYMAREVLSRMLGRPLLPKEEAHYITTDLSDNTRSNIKLGSKQTLEQSRRVKEKLANLVNLPVREKGIICEIPLLGYGDKYKAYVYSEDYDYIMCFTWIIHDDGYVYRCKLKFEGEGYKTGKIFMHRVILERKLGRPLLPHPEEMCDHKDGNKQNNLRYNLRLASTQQNNSNHPVKSTSSTGIKGVTLVPSGRYRACIKVDGVGHSKTYDTPEEADNAYRQMAEYYQGEYASHISRGN